MAFNTSSFLMGVGTVLVTIGIGFGGGVLMSNAFVGTSDAPNKLERRAADAGEQLQPKAGFEAGVEAAARQPVQSVPESAASRPAPVQHAVHRDEGVQAPTAVRRVEASPEPPVQAAVPPPAAEAERENANAKVSEAELRRELRRQEKAKRAERRAERRKAAAERKRQKEEELKAVAERVRQDEQRREPRVVTREYVVQSPRIELFNFDD